MHMLLLGVVGVSKNTAVRVGFALEVERNCASARLPMPLFLIQGTPWVAESQTQQRQHLQQQQQEPGTLWEHVGHH